MVERSLKQKRYLTDLTCADDKESADEQPKELRDHQVFATTRRLGRLLDVMCLRDDVIDRQAELPIR